MPQRYENFLCGKYNLNHYALIFHPLPALGFFSAGNHFPDINPGRQIFECFCKKLTAKCRIKSQPNAGSNYGQMPEKFLIICCNSRKNSIFAASKKNYENMDEYRPRIADKLLVELLEACGCVLVEGSKWCGKTTTAEQSAGSIVYMADPVEGERNRQLAKATPHFLLQGATPRLIDEWQVVPTLWDAIRGEVDHRREDGVYVVPIGCLKP